MQNGVLKQWKKDFGFIQVENGERYFVHISALKRGGIHQPRIGDMIYFTIGHDKQGRPRAQTTARNPEQLAKANARRVAHQQAAAPTHLDLVDYLALAAFLIAIVLLLLSSARLVLAALLLGMSALSFVAYAYDKVQAKRNAWRLPEAHLQLLALIGGWPGAWLAQRRLRHKTQKGTFRIVYAVCVLLNVVGLVYVVKVAGI